MARRVLRAGLDVVRRHNLGLSVHDRSPACSHVSIAGVILRQHGAAVVLRQPAHARGARRGVHGAQEAQPRLRRSRRRRRAEHGGGVSRLVALLNHKLVGPEVGVHQVSDGHQVHSGDVARHAAVLPPHIREGGCADDHRDSRGLVAGGSCSGSSRVGSRSGGGLAGGAATASAAAASPPRAAPRAAGLLLLVFLLRLVALIRSFPARSRS